MAKKSKLSNPFLGLWHFVSMSAWDKDYLNEEVQAFIEFDEKGQWLVSVWLCSGFIDHRMANRDSCGTLNVNNVWSGPIAQEQHGTRQQKRACARLTG